MQRLPGSFVLISMLNPEPILPTTNVLDNDLQTKDNANLSLRNERKIVGALAFLFALTDDPTKVSALCLERDAQQSACVIRVAMNTGVPQSYLISFSKIARALEDLARSGDSNSYVTLSKQVIDVNRNRILSRLRSKHAQSSKSMKAAFADRLRAMTGALSALEHPAAEVAALKVVVSKLVEDIALLEATPHVLVNAGESDEKILTVLSRMDDLPETSRLRTLLDQLPADKFSNPESLLLAITKLRNYHGSCQLLGSAVRNFKFFQCVSVQTVDARTTVPLREPQVSASIHEILGRLNIQWDHDSARKFGVNLRKANAQFQREMATLKPKVHAEVQLIYHYEMNPQLERPRVICSSKSACYLCDTFVKLHSEFFISRTHGVLYPQWTLPNIPQGSIPPEREQAMQSNVGNLARRVEDLLRDLWIRPQTRRLHPNESAVSLMHWTPLSSTSTSTTTNQPVSGSYQTKDSIHMCTVNPRVTPEANGVPAKTLTVSRELSRLEGSASLSGTDLAVSSSTSHDLNCQDGVQTSANIGDHGSRSCLAQTARGRLKIAEAHDYASASLSRSDDTGRRIDFHDSGIQMVLEFPTHAVVSIATGEQSERLIGTVVVDLATLSPGCEVSFDLAGDSDEGRSIVLVQKLHNETVLWWKIIWRY
ncbi:hypothetical protein LTS08_008593 [Lithohypha guttulata]|uniref:uncharacterized protein n=1 Tax=Lithohypha guttulata TaxID=1690604 RepID=UPI002DDEA042|nr:hypothetical protein LTS08_008593 [Lithohypha guttulata]